MVRQHVSILPDIPRLSSVTGTKTHRRISRSTRNQDGNTCKHPPHEKPNDGGQSNGLYLIIDVKTLVLCSRTSVPKALYKNPPDIAKISLVRQKAHDQLGKNCSS